MQGFKLFQNDTLNIVRECLIRSEVVINNSTFKSNCSKTCYRVLTQSDFSRLNTTKSDYQN